MKVSDYIVNFLKTKGVDVIFGYQGGTITHLVDSIYRTPNINFVSTYNEQGAAFAAEGYSRATSKLGVAIATSGPGATNLITGIGSCYFDSISCLFITGQVHLDELKKNPKTRQEGFQETDIVSIVKPITKYAKTIKSAKDIRYYLEKAIGIALSGRHGPVLLDIPINLQGEDIIEDDLKTYIDENILTLKPPNSSDILEVINLLMESKRPIVLAGGGVRLSEATNELLEFIELSNLPVVTSLMGLDSISHHHKNFAGYIGAYGNRYGNLALANSDLVLILGARLPSRQTGTNLDEFTKKAKFIHVDIDENELNLRVKETLSLKCDIKLFLTLLNTHLTNNNPLENIDLTDWLKRIREFKSKYPSFPTQSNFLGIDPNETMDILSKKCPSNTSFVLDVGQNQIWAAQSLEIRENQRILTGGGMGAMGFAIPAAIGAWYGDKSRNIVVIVGDGGLQMNIQELQVIAREKLPIKIILMNNHSLGMIRHFQELYFQNRYYGTIDGYTTPNFIEIFKAYGIDGFRVIFPSDLTYFHKMFLKESPQLIEVNLQKKTYVIPKLEMGHPLEDQSPLLPREELRDNMNF